MRTAGASSRRTSSSARTTNRPMSWRARYRISAGLRPPRTSILARSSSSPSSRRRRAARSVASSSGSSRRRKELSAVSLGALPATRSSCSVSWCSRVVQGEPFDKGDARGSPPERKLIADRYKNEDFCYLTTTGRVTGRPHTIEIWFSLYGQTLYMLSGGRERSDWVKNLQRAPEVTVRIGSEHFEGYARVVEDSEEDELARQLLVDKYETRPGSLSNWRRTALPVAVDLAV